MFVKYVIIKPKSDLILGARAFRKNVVRSLVPRPHVLSCTVLEHRPHLGRPVFSQQRGVSWTPQVGRMMSRSPAPREIPHQTAGRRPWAGKLARGRRQLPHGAREDEQQVQPALREGGEAVSTRSGLFTRSLNDFKLRDRKDAHERGGRTTMKAEDLGQEPEG